MNEVEKQELRDALREVLTEPETLEMIREKLDLPAAADRTVLPWRRKYE